MKSILMIGKLIAWEADIQKFTPKPKDLNE